MPRSLSQRSLKKTQCRAATIAHTKHLLYGNRPGKPHSGGTLSEAKSRNDQTRKNQLSEHYHIGSGANEEREISDGPRSGALDGRGSGGMLADPAQLHPTTRYGLGTRAASRVSILLPRPEWWVDDDPGPRRRPD
jgi:hypothetical protein